MSNETTDRELLELAARATGTHFEVFVDGKYIRRDTDGRPVYWNPLTDDADAFRLAVKLRMRVEPWGSGASAVVSVDNRALVAEPHYGDDPERATRRAIVRAAAAISGTKQEPTN